MTDKKGACVKCGRQIRQKEVERNEVIFKIGHIEIHAATEHEAVKMAALSLFIFNFPSAWEAFMKEFNDLKAVVAAVDTGVESLIAKYNVILAQLQAMADAPTAAEVKALVDQLTAEKGKLEEFLANPSTDPGLAAQPTQAVQTPAPAPAPVPEPPADPAPPTPEAGPEPDPGPEAPAEAAAEPPEDAPAAAEPGAETEQPQG